MCIGVNQCPGISSSGQCLHTRFFMFVKYTKTLSVRNQHSSESRAFLLHMLGISHTRRAALPSRRIVAPHRVRSTGPGSTPAAPRETWSLQSAPVPAWVSAIPTRTARAARHPLPDPGALAHRLRAIATYRFQIRRDYETQSGEWQAQSSGVPHGHCVWEVRAARSHRVNQR